MYIRESSIILKMEMNYLNLTERGAEPYKENITTEII